MARKRQYIKKKKSSVGHTRAIQRDRSKRSVIAPPDEEITHRLSELLQPAIQEHQVLYKKLGLRNRNLTLSVMVAIVVSMIWRQLGSGGSEVARLLRSEGLLWAPVMTVSQQAISERLRFFPPEMFMRILQSILPELRKRRLARQRPLPPLLNWANQQYTAVLAVDASTLDALMRKVGLLRDRKIHPLAGRLMGVIDLCSWLPQTIWYAENDKTSEQSFWPQILKTVPEGALLILDLGFTNFKFFAKLMNVTFITRAKSNLCFQVAKVHQASGQVRDWQIWIGKKEKRQLVRLVQIFYQGKWYRYLTNELNPKVLPALYVAALYRQRWSIEDAFNIVKRLLGLAYFWTGSQHGVLLQVWATWILFGVLVDLTDAVANELGKPFMDISMEMTYRGLYYFTQAHQKGDANNIVAYLVANANWLGIVKRRRKRSDTELLPLTNPRAP
jgi:hypothetical protein